LLNDSGEAVTESGAVARYRGGMPDSLPVLQHALMRTYLVWKSLPPKPGRTTNLIWRITAMPAVWPPHWTSMQRASFTQELDDAERLWAERVFRSLTTTEFGQPVRRPTPLADLYNVIGAREADRATSDRVLEIFRRRENSFLQVNKDGSVDISHESLIWKWKRLNGWVALEAASAELYRDLVKDAPGRATWGEPKLSSAVKVRNRDRWNVDWALQYSEAASMTSSAFLAPSGTAARNQKLLRWFALAATLAVVISQCS
jgi:hypothetical protein